LPSMKQLFILVLAVTGTLFMAMMMQSQGRALVTCGTPGGIIDLEMAANPTAASKVLAEWRPVQCPDGGTGITVAIANTKLDFFFIPFYTLLFYMTSLILGQSLPGWAGRLGRWLRWCSVLAGVLDVVENLFMFGTFKGSITSMGTYSTAICAKIKFGLLAACLLYLLAGLGWLVFVKRARVIVNSEQ
jgi:hypothetical protein